MNNEMRWQLLDAARGAFVLLSNSPHGPAHWERVRGRGLWLAERTGADAELVEMFAYLHDSKRKNDGKDKKHGARAALFAKGLNDSLLHLEADRLEVLVDAIARHSYGWTFGTVTAMTCWDSDRLDLTRLGMQIDRLRLCTDAARGRAGRT